MYERGCAFIGEKILYINNEVVIKNYYRYYNFKKTELEKMRQILLMYANENTSEHINNIYGQVRFYAMPIDESEKNFYIGINKNNCQWSPVSIDDDIIFLVTVKKTQKQCEITLFLEKLCV